MPFVPERSTQGMQCVEPSAPSRGRALIRAGSVALLAIFLNYFPIWPGPANAAANQGPLNGGEKALAYPISPDAGSSLALAWPADGPIMAAAGLTSISEPASHVPVILAAGDIVTCAPDAGAIQTAALLDSLEGTVVTLGDNVYHKGTDEEFANCYSPTWGRHKARTKPVPGNHEYLTRGAGGYFRYFGEAATPLDEDCTYYCKGYYSYDLGDWHIIALNSEIDMGFDSEQVQWLRDDLAAHPSVCTLAYWHRPRFSSGAHGSAESVQPLWQTLVEYGADVVLNGHDHDYERFAPQNARGEVDAARGIRQFIVGTGGSEMRLFGTIQPNSQVRDYETWGVLKLTLHATSYDWEFVPVGGQPTRDTGSSPCFSGGNSTETPASPSQPAQPERQLRFFPVIR